MTYGTLGYGFFGDTVQFRRNVHYWHIIPSCAEMGFKSPGMPAPDSMASFAESSHLLEQLAFAASAAELAKSRSLA